MAPMIVPRRRRAGPLDLFGADLSAGHRAEREKHARRLDEDDGHDEAHGQAGDQIRTAAGRIAAAELRAHTAQPGCRTNPSSRDDGDGIPTQMPISTAMFCRNPRANLMTQENDRQHQRRDPMFPAAPKSAAGAAAGPGRRRRA